MHPTNESRFNICDAITVGTLLLMPPILIRVVFALMLLLLLICHYYCTSTVWVQCIFLLIGLG